MKFGTLILLRHGESIYNQQNLFTGWTDVDLSEQGVHEAREAGEKLLRHGLYPDICFTSWLKRAIHTSQLALNFLEWEQIDVIRSFALNERHYGDWQGREKGLVRKQYGETMFLSVRRGYDTPPPALKKSDPRTPEKEHKYQNIDPNSLPVTESLKMTKARVIDYYRLRIQSYLRKGETVLISAHGNSLRALVMYLEDISEEKIPDLEIPTGDILVYTMDSSLHIVGKEHL